MGNARLRLEGYGPGGAALMVDCLTDAPERTVAEVRHVLREWGGRLGASQSVSYLFNEVGRVKYPPGTAGQKLMTAALDAGAEDVVSGADGSVEVLTDPLDLNAVRTRLAAQGFPPPEGEVTQRSSVSVPLQGAAAESMAALIDRLEHLADVQDVYSNAEIPDEVLARV